MSLIHCYNSERCGTFSLNDKALGFGINKGKNVELSTTSPDQEMATKVARGGP